MKHGPFSDCPEQNYELWQVTFLWDMKIQKLHIVILSNHDDINDCNFVEKNATALVQLIQCLDDRNQSLIIMRC